MDKLVIYICKLLYVISKWLGGGSSLPGRVALKLRPGLWRTMVRGYRVIMVTGTNGKTTTSAMIKGILEKAGHQVIHNGSGANMTDGIATTFVTNYGKKGYAVIECDEAYTRIINRHIKPEYMVVTNIFRDQLDRFGEISNTWGKIKEAIYASPRTKLVLNADQALFAKPDFENPIYYYGFGEGRDTISEDGEVNFCPECGSRFGFRFVTFKNLGDYYCPKCGFARPKCAFAVDSYPDLRPDGSDFTVNGQKLSLGVSGLYNVYNALAAFAVTSLMGVSPSLIAEGIKAQQSCFGRNESVDVYGNSLQFFLVKNPTGYDECLNTVSLCKENCSLLLMLNDNWGDGTDVSWIWDAHLEKLSGMNIDTVLIGGTRRYDMAIRARAAHLPEEKFVFCENDTEIIERVKNAPSRVFALCTYTAMTNLRKTMYQKGIVKDMWQ